MDLELLLAGDEIVPTRMFDSNGEEITPSLKNDLPMSSQIIDDDYPCDLELKRLCISLGCPFFYEGNPQKTLRGIEAHKILTEYAFSGEFEEGVRLVNELYPDI